MRISWRNPALCNFVKKRFLSGNAFELKKINSTYWYSYSLGSEYDTNQEKYLSSHTGALSLSLGLENA